MTGWLLDTNIISELRRPKPEPKVVAFVRGKPLEALYISAVTLAEIRFGMFKWHLLIEEGRKAGHTFSQPDSIIATTAQHHGLTVVSRDTKEYITARVEVFSPWG